MTELRTCASEHCWNEIPPQVGRQRPRKYCEVCRPPRARPNPRVIDLAPPPRDAAAPPQRPAYAEAALVESVRRRLTNAKRADDPLGVQALLLAQVLSAGNMTASGAASLSRELRATMDAALAGAPAEPDALDEFSRRLQQKIANA